MGVHSVREVGGCPNVDKGAEQLGKGGYTLVHPTPISQDGLE